MTRRSSQLNHMLGDSDEKVRIRQRRGNAQFAGIDSGWLRADFDATQQRVRLRLFADRDDVTPVAESAEVSTAALPKTVDLDAVGGSGITGSVYVDGVRSGANELTISNVQAANFSRTTVDISCDMAPSATARYYYRTATGPGAWQFTAVFPASTSHDESITGLTEGTTYDLYIVGDEGGPLEIASPGGAPGAGMFHTFTTPDAQDAGAGFEVL